MTATRDHYKTLQVDPEADADVITAAYRALARRLHPETDASGVDEYRMAELNRAYAVLKNAGRRKAYDIERGIQLTLVGPGADANGAENAGEDGDEREHGHGEGPRLDFGRYSGWTLAEIAAEDADYLRWLSRHSSGLRFRHEISRLLREEPQTAYAPRDSR